MLSHSPLHFRDQHVVKEDEKHLNVNISHNSILALVKHGFVIATSHTYAYTHACTCMYTHKSVEAVIFN